MTFTGRTAVVLHGVYGCDTGCCLHTVGLVTRGLTLGGIPGRYDEIFDAEEWDFMFHPHGRDPREWAEALVEKTYPGATLDWEHSAVVDD